MRSARAGSPAAPAGDLGVAHLGQAREDVAALQEGVDVGRGEAYPPVLGGDEGFLHDVRQADGPVEADDAGRPLERVGGPHERFDLLGVGRVAFQVEQPPAERRRLAARLLAEQVEHRQVGVAHRVFPRRVWNRRSSSSRPTERPRVVEHAARQAGERPRQRRRAAGQRLAREAMHLIDLVHGEDPALALPLHDEEPGLGPLGAFRGGRFAPDAEDGVEVGAQVQLAADVDEAGEDARAPGDAVDRARRRSPRRAAPTGSASHSSPRRKMRTPTRSAGSSSMGAARRRVHSSA